MADGVQKSPTQQLVLNLDFGGPFYTQGIGLWANQVRVAWVVGGKEKCTWGILDVNRAHLGNWATGGRQKGREKWGAKYK